MHDTHMRYIHTQDIDACVLALGAKGLKSVLTSSAPLALACPELAAASTLGAVDVVSVRIWLDRCATYGT